MNNIEVKSIPISKVVADVAKYFNTTVNKDCSEYSLKIPKEFGRGYIKGMEFGDGVGLIHYDCTFLRDTEIQFVKNSVHPLKFMYSLEKEFSHRFENEEKLHNVEQYQNVIVASNGHNGHILKFRANSRTCINSLEILRLDFQKKMHCELKSIGSELENLFNDTKALQVFYYQGYYSLRISELFYAMLQTEKDGIVRKIFLEATALSMLGEVISQYQNDLKMDGNSTKGLLTRMEVKLIDEASLLIRTEIDDLGTIDVIAHKVGLNVNKLQNGFKYMYNLSVNEYVKKTRLDLATYLLLNSDFTMAEIVEKIGLSSNSYFSRIFKEEYKINPSQFRKSNYKAKKDKLSNLNMN